MGSELKIESNEEMIGNVQRFHQNVVCDAVACVNQVQLVA